MRIGFSPTPQRSLFWFLTVTVFGLCVFAIDAFLGRFEDLAIIREHSLKFRSEAVQLSVRTKILVPNTVHVYQDVVRPEQEDHLAIDAPRVFRTNEYGIIRGPEKKTENHQSTILFLGGSTTESNEVDEPFRFPALVETLLSDEYHLNVRTWNSGVRGHTTIDSINLLLNHPNYKSADFVVLMHNINDRLRLAVQGDYVASLSSPAPLSFEKIIVSATELASDILDFLSYRSNILFAARTRLSKINPFVGEPTNPAINERSIDFFDEHFPSSLKKFRLNVETFIALTRVRGQTPILMTQPLGRSSYGQDIFNEEIRKAGSDNNVLVIDLDRALASDRQGLFLSDNIHLSNNGSIAVANVIVRDLARKLGSNVVKALPTGNLQHLSKTCLSAPEVGERFVAGPRHVLLDRHGRYPTFSADGKKLLFQTYQTGNERIQIYDIESEVYESLSDVGASYMDRHPTVISQTINGSFKIAYGSDRSGSERVYIMDWPSKTVEPLLEAYSLYGAIPARGPGQTVLFAGFSHKLQPAEHGIPDLFMYDLGNKQLRQLTETKEEEWRPVVSHDGKFVYYISNYHGDFDIFRKSLAGSKVQLVYRSKADEWDPSLSTDDRWLVFASKQKGNWDLFVMDLFHPETTIQVTDGTEDDWDPVFYADERVIVFASSNGNQPGIFALCTFGELTN